jgi:antirestriction protein ArdC
MAGTKDDKKPYYEMISERLIQQLEEGTAPWQKPWEPGIQRMPHNPVSGTRYKGANALWLSMQGRSDPRWMTYKQAKSVNAQVMKGEKGTMVQYWKFRDRVPKKENGKPVLDAEGKKVMINVELDKPKVFSAVVFNAEQIQGLPPLEAKQTIPEWERHERAEAILSASGANINHDQGDRAFYSPVRDSIHLPEKGQFESADRYYATALHELGHWTGHPTRLDRDLSGRFGSESYAAEELRAEIASMGIGEELEIGHDPGQHASYVKSWIKVLKDDPKEILRAARDAEKIHDMVMGFERDRDQKQDNQAMVSPAAAEKLHKLDRDAVEGYSPMESWKMMQAEAASNGYTARIDLNKDRDEFASAFVIDYQDKDGTDTGIQTDLYADSKMETSIHGRRLSKFISNDSESQPRHLREAFQEHETAKAAQPSSDDEKAPQKPQEAETDPQLGKDSALPLKLAEKYAQNFASEADRARFLERVQDRLGKETEQAADIRIRESVARDADSDIER